MLVKDPMYTRVSKFAVAPILIFSTLNNGIASSVANVQYLGKRITGMPAKQHSAQGQNIEVIETEECNSKVASHNSIEVSENCKFLHGVYRYIFTPRGEEVRHQVFIDFSLSKSGGKNHSFLVNEPLEIDENSVRTLP